MSKRTNAEEEKSKMRDEAKMMFEKLKEEDQNYWLYISEKTIMILEENSPTDSEIKEFALDAFYCASKDKHPAIPVKDRKKYEKLPDFDKNEYEQKVKAELERDGKNPAVYPIKEMALSLWWEINDREEFERFFNMEEYSKMTDSEKILNETEARRAFMLEGKSYDSLQLMMRAYFIWMGVEGSGPGCVLATGNYLWEEQQ